MMNKRKNTYILFLILIILSIVAYFRYKVRRKKFLPPKQETFLFPYLDIDRINRAEIINLKSRTVLEKRDKNWVVVTSGNYPADMRLIKTLFRRIKSLNSDEIVTDKPLKHSIFNVGGTGTKVKLFEGEDLIVSFYIGKSDDDYIDTYLRKEGSNKVLVIHDNIQQIFTPYEWRSHQLFNFQPKEVKEITVTFPDGIIHIKRKETGGWDIKSQQKGLLDGQRLEKFLKNLVSLKSMDFAKQESDWKTPDEPKFKIQIKLKDESVRTLVVGGVFNPTTFYVRVLEETPIFLVPARWLNQLERYWRRNMS